LLEIAATLDRLDRAQRAHPDEADPRLTFIHRALGILQSAPSSPAMPSRADGSGRAEAIQRLYSLE
jgi:hypothetical protein